jgi:hypothetical protein
VHLSVVDMPDIDPIDLLRAYVAVRVEVERRPAAPILDDLVHALDRAGRRHRGQVELVHVVGRIRQLAIAEVGRPRAG